MALKIVGAILVIFGLVDLIGSFAGFDLWGTLGIVLPDPPKPVASYVPAARTGDLLAAILEKQPAVDVLTPEVESAPLRRTVAHGAGHGAAQYDHHRPAVYLQRYDERTRMGFQYCDL